MVAFSLKNVLCHRCLGKRFNIKHLHHAKASTVRVGADAILTTRRCGRSASRHSLNADYAVAAVYLLRTCPELADAKHNLWQAIHRDRPRVIAHNLDVVLALWLNGDLL